MTIFGGIASIDSARPIARAMLDDLAKAITRNPADRPRLFEGPGYAFAKVDLGIFSGDGAYVDDAGGVSLLAGAPLLAGIAATGSSRHDELRALHDAWKREDQSLLKGARGSFCAAHFDPALRRLWLVSDKIGLRPIYYAVQGGYLFFSTALRILESLAAVERRIDLRGVTETVALGYPLGNRSPYETISTLGAGEVVEVLRSGTRRFHYWRWDNLPEAGLSTAELAASLFRVFEDAVRRRLQDQRAVVSLLSGGLDSRCIVACLRHLGTKVHTLNFGAAGSADLVLGKLAAGKLGTRHFEFPTGPLDFWDRMRTTHASWLSEVGSANEVERPRLLWSGDGGSCGLGHIYLNEEIVALMRAGRIGEAVDAYLRFNGVELPKRLFVREQRERVREFPHAGIVEELGKLSSFDAGRRFHVFLMVNGQRRLQARHYEDIDLRRFELVSPFFDSEFLQLILASRIDDFLRHRFYTRWLQEYPPEARAAPWQVYPGHDPCPVPAPEGLRWQWHSQGVYRKDENRAVLRQELAMVEKILRDPRFPGWLLDRKILRLAAWFTRLGFGDYSYLFRAARTIARYSP